jgi:hypothetical protein
VNTKKTKRPAKRIVLYFLFITASLTVQAQVPNLDSMLRRYQFIRPELSIIHNDSISMHSFYQKMAQLKNGKNQRVNIVHLGDSHIQADLFSGTVRQLVQIDYGNAGRGFIFPYRVAKSNEPPSYKTTTNVKWESKRNVFPNQPLPIGIGGFTIETKDSTAMLSISVKDQGPLNYGFNKFTLFHEKGAGSYGYSVCDELSCKVGRIDSRNTDSSRFASVQLFNTPMHQLMIRCTAGDSGNCARIYGILLENGAPGVLYNMIGVNGAEYRHFNLSEHFQEQFTYLQPDLVIISMGTNEGFSAGFDRDAFTRNMDSLVSGIRSRNPHAEILLTTPGDSFRKSKKGRVKNPNMTLARNAVIDYAESHQCAWWDLYEIMGGYGSMAKWFAAKIAAKDRVHFSGTGYIMQGGLLYRAMKKGCDHFPLAN